MIIYDILLWVNPAKQVIPKVRPYQKVRPSHQKGSAYIQEPGSFERHSNTKVVGDQGIYIYVVIMQKTALMIKLCLIGVSISLCKTTLLKDSKLSANEVHASSCMRHGGGSQSEPASATQVPIRSRFLRFRVFSGPKPGNSESRCHTNREHHSLATGGCDWCGNMWDTSHKVASQWGKWW